MMSTQKRAPFAPLSEIFRYKGFKGDERQSQVSELKGKRGLLGSAFPLFTLKLWTADAQLHKHNKPAFPPYWQAIDGEDTLESEG